MSLFSFKETSPSLSKNVVFNFAGQATTVVVAVVSMPFLINLLGNDRIGLLSLIRVIIIYLSILDLGMGLSVTKLVSASIPSLQNERIPKIFWNAVVTQLFFGIAGGTLLILFTPYLVYNVLHIPDYLLEEAKLSLIISGIAFPIVLISSSTTGILQAIQRFDLLAALQIPSGIAQFLLPVCAAFFWHSLPIAVFSILLTRFILLVFSFYFSLQKVPILKNSWSISKEEIKNLFNYGGWVTVSNVIAPIMAYADRFFLGYIMPVSAVAFYSVPTDAVIRLLVFPKSLMTVLFPVFSELESTDGMERTNELITRSLKYITIFLGIFVVTLFIYAKDILFFWVGPEFASQSTTALRVLLIGILFYSVTLIPFNLLQARGRADVTAKVHMIEFPLYVLLSYYCIMRYGINGAAYAWSIRLFVETIILFVLSWRICKISLSAFVNNDIIMIFIMLGGMFFISEVLINYVVLLIEKIFFGALLALSFLLFSWKHILNVSDRLAITKILKWVHK